MPSSFVFASVTGAILGVLILVSQSYLLAGLSGVVAGTFTAAVTASFGKGAPRSGERARAREAFGLTLMIGSETLTYLG
jgi:hypothetical protein